MRPGAYAPLLRQISGWKIEKTNPNKISRKFRFKNFKDAIKFVNKVASVAEREGHHPDFAIHYNRVVLTLWTHAIGGLSQNDFILAAKINEIVA